MKWNKYSIQTTTDAVDMISSALNDIGIEGIEIEDNVQLTKEEAKSMFVDFIPDLPPDDGRAKVNFYIDSEEDDGSMLEKVKAELEDLRMFIDIGEGTITESETEDKDWINNWKQYWHTFTIGDLFIKPTWEPETEEMKGHAVLSIDPGTAFGTGMHETTQLCIRALKKYVTSETEILDVGCGSGILGMLALKFGAKHSLGTDLDPCAVTAVKENMEVNGLKENQYDVILGNIIDDPKVQSEAGEEAYDIVTANILAEVLLPLTPVVIHQLKKGGIYITSGIIDDKETVVVEAVKAAGLEVLEVTHQGEWVSVTARKN